ncbi:MAG TPA: YceD family protein [Steroidobacter sp.]|nr:YceD family protein [Steroidobacter sp.]
MPRPPAVPSDVFVDAEACARAGSCIVRRFGAAELPRLREADVRDGWVEVSLQFSHVDALPAIDGELSGEVITTCQRCMRDVAVSLQEGFQVAIAPQERADEPGGYEPVIAEASRLDVKWLAEEQVLLAIPLAPMHAADGCNHAPASFPSEGENETDARQKPFQNLRDLLRER